VSDTSASPAQRIDWRIVLFLTILAIALRWQTFDNPVLEHDEQFYLLVGDRMLHGALPFVDIFDRKPVGLFLIYAAIRLLGGDGVIQYQMVALIFVVATATLLHRFALRLTNQFGAVAAACAYIAWLDITEGEGGQAPVFFNLPMLAAAMLCARVVTGRSDQPGRDGTAAMALVGIAIQIKYTVVVEGIYFGIMLLWAAWHRGDTLPSLAKKAILWAGLAVLPTLVAAIVYAGLGHAHEFIFANFQSQFGRSLFPLKDRLLGLLGMVGLVLPLLASIRRTDRSHDGKTGRFVLGWLGAALLSVLVFGSFMSTHYIMPSLLPAVLAAAPFFGRKRLGRFVALGLLASVGIAGQIALAHNQWAKGGRREADIVAAAARPVHGCIYVYDGYPALYQLTGSCLPTRYAFPGHLSTADEGNAAAIGRDPAVELRRILAGKPEVIVDDAPVYQFSNPATRNIINQALSRDYYQVLRLRTGTQRYRLVYRRKENH